ncbi:MAG TPA: sigma-70 family RNA polymerase sigma factor [Myxococcota bacterium]|nr:sigma-70 family RNA polymerase sigma factor [Myxococcota bacterium]
MSDETGARAASADEEARWVAEMAAGRAEALAGLYDRHAAAMLGLAARVLGDPRDAEDLVHDVFLEAWRKAASYDRRRGPVRGWLLVMVRSRALDRLRGLEVMRRYAKRIEAADPIAVTQVEHGGLHGVARARALEAISALPEAQRHIVRMSCLEGFSCSEIARQCGLPVGTVKSRLARAIAALRDRLGGEEAF